MGYDKLYMDEKNGIIYKKWLAPKAKAVFLLVHGMGGHSNRWEFLANFFLPYNISSYAIELKGFGHTKTLKGHIDSFDIYFNDITTLADIIKQENSGKKVFLIGESMGGLIAFSLAGVRQNLFDGLICISPAFKSRLRFPVFEYIGILFCMVFFPKRQFNMPFDSSMCTRYTDYQSFMDKNENEHRLATPKLLLNIIQAQARANSLKDKIKIPTLFLTAGEIDKVIDPGAAKKVFESLTLQDKQIIQYPEMCHALSIDIGREKVFKDILDWVNKLC